MSEVLAASDLSLVADRLKLLGDKTRLTMLLLLKDREWCVCEFVDIFEMSQPAISQHIRKLKSLDLVKESRRSQWIYYSLHVEDKPYIQAVLESLPDAHQILKNLNKRDSKSSCCIEK
ncbi:HTH-type transcriptional repressor AseR [Paenibacillus sp. J45TS6]|uniref:ArsR/SmtB family transcription factor n=1 Tax=unclassified Paenibacillus TaxID=185978 RepID=UPI00191F7479|nr:MULTISPECIES: metalloregulator ArsR/SmtB family transcription factor [unclassified Paenibacillus]BCO11063.1 metalloregulator ArsR/SmtB family transcription factor [Paenibacillus sp.]GIP46088.1 HTH-type transcriptional repressor AseR [Paenibacillus sp. J45TS6]